MVAHRPDSQFLKDHKKNFWRQGVDRCHVKGVLTTVFVLTFWNVGQVKTHIRGLGGHFVRYCLVRSFASHACSSTEGKLGAGGRAKAGFEAAETLRGNSFFRAAEGL